MTKETEGTRDRIVAAAVRTLRTEGYSGTTARSIARAGGFNQGLIYYYFDDLDELLLAALDQASAERMDGYVDALPQIGSLSDMARVGLELFQKDIKDGHAKLVSEFMAAALANPDLGPVIAARLQPWTRLAKDSIANALGDSPLKSVIPADQLAKALVALYIGLEMQYQLDGDASLASTLFGMVGALAPLVEKVLNP
jgi:AcrR family transcriptional regulator